MSRTPIPDDAVTTRAEALLREGAWGSSMVLDDPYVVCPGCRTAVYEHKMRLHAERCEPLRARARVSEGGAK